MPYNIQYRLANEKDAEYISALLQQSFKEFEQQYTSEAFAATTPSAAEIKKRLKDGYVWVAIKDEKIVGTVSAFITSKGLHIRSMAVYPQYRGNKIGYGLLNQAENFAMTKKINPLYLRTTPFLHEAIFLYNKYGFNEFDEEPYELFGTPLLSMKKNLNGGNEAV